MLEAVAAASLPATAMSRCNHQLGGAGGGSSSAATPLPLPAGSCYWRSRLAELLILKPNGQLLVYQGEQRVYQGDLHTCGRGGGGAGVLLLGPPSPPP